MKYYSTILRSNGLKINTILDYENQYKNKSLMTISNPEQESIWKAEQEEEDEENLRKIAEEFKKNLDDNNGTGLDGSHAKRTYEDFIKADN